MKKFDNVNALFPNFISAIYQSAIIENYSISLSRKTLFILFHFIKTKT